MKPKGRIGYFLIAGLLIATVLLGVQPSTAVAAGTPISFVQGAVEEDSASDTEIARAFNSNVTVGNFIVATFTWGASDNTTIVGCSDTQGNSYTVATQTWSSGQWQALATCYAVVGSSGSNTVTATFSTPSDWRALVISEYNGVGSSASVLAAESTALDNVPAGIDAATTATVSSTFDGALVYGAFQIGGSVSEGTGYTNRLASSNGLIAEDRILVAAGSVNATATTVSTVSYASNVLLLRPAGATQGAEVSVEVQPSFSFAVGNRSTACNGESSFVASAGSANGVNLGRIAASSSLTGGQTLTVGSNASSGFVVYLSGLAASGNLQSQGHAIADTTGTYAVPVIWAGGGTESFGYTYFDSTSSSSVVPAGANKFIQLTNVGAVVMGSAATPNGSGCVSYGVSTSGTTFAGAYSATVIYTAVPSF